MSFAIFHDTKTYYKLAFLIISFLFVNQTYSLEQCRVDKTVIENEKLFSHIVWSPNSIYDDSSNGTILVNELTTLIFTCKSNAYRYKHHCGSDGNWDLVPGSKTCQIRQGTTCLHPSKSWNLWTWNCYDLLFPGAICSGSCIFDEGFSISIECLDDGTWMVPEEINLVESCNNCVNGWQSLSNILSKTYCFVAEALNYENAEKNCNRINGILFEPKSNEENTNVYQTFSELLHSQVWIGINDKENEGVFVYTSNSEAIVFDNWAPSQPDDSTGEDCTEFRPSFGEEQWNDWHCESESPSICEKSAT